jgi:hypothetical protein
MACVSRPGDLQRTEPLAMKFHEYRTLWGEMRGQLPRQATEEQFYAVAAAGGLRAGNGLALAEGTWKQHRRPYYQVWPAIVPTDTDAGNRRTSTATVATVAELGRLG